MKYKLVQCNYSDECDHKNCQHKQLHLKEKACVNDFSCGYALRKYNVIAHCVQIPIILTNEQKHWLYTKLQFKNMNPFVPKDTDIWIEILETMIYN